MISIVACRQVDLEGLLGVTANLLKRDSDKELQLLTETVRRPNSLADSILKVWLDCGTAVDSPQFMYEI
jgi:hypothetical protein